MNEAEKFNQLHALCPKCQSPSIEQTCIGTLYPDDYPAEKRHDPNTASCKCGWKGSVMDLKPLDGEITPEWLRSIGWKKSGPYLGYHELYYSLPGSHTPGLHCTARWLPHIKTQSQLRQLCQLLGIPLP